MYIVLFAAIMIASVGDVLLKKSEGFRRLGVGSMAILVYIFIFYLLAIIMQDLPVGITYTTWSGLGVVLSTLIGVFLFKEKLNWKAMASMCLIIAGVVLLNV